jgi:uncharacterized protein
MFECDGCGACCRTFPIFADTADAARETRIEREGRRLPDHLRTPRWTYQLFPLPFHERCCFLDDGDRCTIYLTRPTVCCEFAAGSDQCQEARRRQGFQELRPASGAA